MAAGRDLCPIRQPWTACVWIVCTSKALSVLLIDRLEPGNYVTSHHGPSERHELYPTGLAVIIIHVLKGLGGHRDAYIHPKFGLNRPDSFLRPRLSAIPMFLEARNHHPNLRLGYSDGLVQHNLFFAVQIILIAVPAIRANVKYQTSHFSA